MKHAKNNVVILGVMGLCLGAAWSASAAAPSYPPPDFNGGLTATVQVGFSNRVVLTWAPDYTQQGYSNRYYIVERSRDNLNWSTVLPASAKYWGKSGHASWTNLDLNNPVGTEYYRVSAAITNTANGNQYFLTNTTIASVSVPVALPDPIDYYTPSWRGASGASVASTHQVWAFGSSANPAPAEVADNPFGPPTAAVVIGQYGAGWSGLNNSQAGNVQGAWDMGIAPGEIDCTIPLWTAASSHAINYALVQVNQLYAAGSQSYDGLWTTPLPLPIIDDGNSDATSNQGLKSTGLLGPNNTIGSWQVSSAIYRLNDGNVAQVIPVQPSDNKGFAVDEVIVDTLTIDFQEDMTVAAVDAASVTYPNLPVVDGTIVLDVTTCNPASGSSFPPGATTVICSTPTILEPLGAASSFTVNVIGSGIQIVTCAQPELVQIPDTACWGVMPDLTGQIVTSGGSAPITVTQVPAPGTHEPAGPVLVTFTATDSTSAQATCGPITITFTAGNGPTAVNDSATVVENTVLTIPAGRLVLNDSSARGPLTGADVTSVSPLSAQGKPVTLVAGTVTYTPGAYFGPDSFTYTLTDCIGLTAVGTVSVTVNPTRASFNLENPQGVASGADTIWTIVGHGIPNRIYGLERATVATGPWTQVATATADATGTISFPPQTTSESVLFWRTQYPAGP